MIAFWGERERLAPRMVSRGRASLGGQPSERPEPTHLDPWCGVPGNRYNGRQPHLALVTMRRCSGRQPGCVSKDLLRTQQRRRGDLGESASRMVAVRL